VLATFIAHGSPASDSLLRSAFRISRTYPLELSYNLFPFVMSEALHLSIGHEVDRQRGTDAVPTCLACQVVS